MQNRHKLFKALKERSNLMSDPFYAKRALALCKGCRMNCNACHLVTIVNANTAQLKIVKDIFLHGTSTDPREPIGIMNVDSSGQINKKER